MPTFKEVWAQKLKELHEHQKDLKDAIRVQVPPEMQADYDALKDMHRNGRSPATIGEAAQALMRAAQIAELQGIKPAVIPGSKDLQWPPAASFQDPMGVAPYLPRFREVLAMTFPQRDTGGKAPAPQRRAEVVPEGDPLAAMKKMVSEAGAKLAPATPLVVEVTNGR